MMRFLHFGPRSVAQNIKYQHLFEEPTTIESSRVFADKAKKDV